MPKVKINKIDMLVLIDNGNYYDKKTPTLDQLAAVFKCTAGAVRANVHRCVEDGLLKLTGKRQNWAYPIISIELTDYGRKCIEEGEIIEER